MERGYGLDIAETVALLRTPAASEAERGHQPEEKAKARGGQVTLSGQINFLPTPVTTDYNTAASDWGVKGFQQLRDLHNLLPTTRAQHGEDRNNRIYARGADKPQNLENALAYLPTPNTMDDLPARDESKIDRSKGGFSNVRETVVRPGFGRFEPAIRRWEQLTGNPAPAPTKPDGKDGNPRLSSHFTEWMMGLEPGWITGVGLSRKDELKACGNGVVPQQAKLALTILLDRVGGRIE
jgi:DNA (cytosine-5)-methyltransferase 1